MDETFARWILVILSSGFLTMLLWRGHIVLRVAARRGILADTEISTFKNSYLALFSRSTHDNPDIFYTGKGRISANIVLATGLMAVMAVTAVFATVLGEVSMLSLLLMEFLCGLRLVASVRKDVSSIIMPKVGSMFRFDDRWGTVALPGSEAPMSKSETPCYGTDTHSKLSEIVNDPTKRKSFLREIGAVDSDGNSAYKTRNTEATKHATPEEILKKLG